MSKKFRVPVGIYFKSLANGEVEIEADSKKEALLRAKQMLEDGDLYDELSSSDFIADSPGDFLHEAFKGGDVDDLFIDCIDEEGITETED